MCIFTSSSTVCSPKLGLPLAGQIAVPPQEVAVGAEHRPEIVAPPLHQIGQGRQQVERRTHDGNRDPRITFELKSGLDKINYYYDDFENVEELTPRTIGGVEMAGRTYKNVGMWWTEYYGEMPTGGWLAIKISGVDIDPGTEGDTVLNSITFG